MYTHATILYNAFKHFCFSGNIHFGYDSNLSLTRSMKLAKGLSRIFLMLELYLRNKKNN